MKNRERIIKTLQCEETDRPPLPAWLGFSPWQQTVERWCEESGIDDLDIRKYFAFDRFFEIVLVECGPLPHFEEKLIEETDEFVTAIDWRGITTRNRRDRLSMPDFIAHPIHSPEEWKLYKDERLQLHLDERLTCLDSFLKKIEGQDVPVQVGKLPWGVFGTPRDLLGAEELLISFYSQPDLVRDIMETMTTLWLAVYEGISKRVQIDCIHIWEDMSFNKGSLISMDMVESFMMPQYDRITEFAKAKGIPIVSVDTDGLVDELVPTMMKHGINAFFPFEVQAGNNVEEYREKYPKLGILGGLDKRALARDKVCMHRELDRAENMLAKGGYIPGFDHLIPPDVPWNNYKYFVEQLKVMVGI
ncbi:uroporphyrinogen decarboxylase family protein [Candidatus Hydrogenedentota bacterium]